ncbi:RiPP maturation radical SAM C-methyltransferase [Streptomyces sp. NPDC127178]|uniref:RiPP maturation radical SAM C-methyltransferase n=1 Tax=unclassified Streptomyces TaxID=2593676 RepID=UPI0036304288
MRVLLVSMPYGALDRPALGISLLKPRLRREGIDCDVRYLTFAFADLIGAEEYDWISRDLPLTAFAGDWLFTPSLYGDALNGDDYLESVLRSTWLVGEQDLARLARAREQCEPFLDACLTRIPWSQYDVVGFTCTFEQNVASLALAKRLSEAHPRLLIAFGGANWEGEMGQELHRSFPFVDIVCSGEADESFPAVLSSLSERRRADLRAIPGIVYRNGRETVSTGPASVITKLDDLPFPDFDDFFRDRAEATSGRDCDVTLPLETSRGCWWGAKAHCTFCGLNGAVMAFRSKSAERVAAEVHLLRDRHGAERFLVVDNILDMHYFTTLLPQLAAERLGVRFAWETKANLTHDQVCTLAEAGVDHIGAGLESLSDHVLGLMRKGTSALRNIQLLKWCREFDIHVEWNFLVGFPGEQDTDYQAMLPLIEAISFLQPPSAWGLIRLDRFSPYHSTPGAYRMTNIRPASSYRYLYPFAEERLSRIAYHFDFDYVDDRGTLDHAAPAIERIGNWMATRPNGRGLWLEPCGNGTLKVIDERQPHRPSELTLRDWQAKLYLACDRVRKLPGLLREQELAHVSSQVAQKFIEECIERQLIARVGDELLALAVTRPPRTIRHATRVAFELVEHPRGAT